MILLFSLFACAPADEGDGTSDPTYPTPSLTADATVIDPTLDGDPAITLSATLAATGAGATCSIEWIVDGPTQARQLGTFGAGEPASWDGRDDDGAPFAPGVVTVWAFSECSDGARGVASLDLGVVRLAPALLEFSAASGTIVPLAFHKRDLVTVRPTPIDVPAYRTPEGRFDDASPAVQPWQDPDLAPWGADPDGVARNVPVAYAGGSTPRVYATPALQTLEGDATVPTGVSVSLSAPAALTWTERVAIDLDPLEATLGRQTSELRWEWVGCVGDGCTPAPIPGFRSTRHTIYRLAGASQLRDGSGEGYADSTPWIGALADTADALEGVPVDDPYAAMDALRDRLFTDPWLIYSPNAGVYSEYAGQYIYWISIASQLSDWLDREQGLSLYCHSMSCLLSVLANTWGIDAQQTVLGVNFTTHLVRAANTEPWIAWGFNSHSVATLENGSLVWDASVEIDVDDSPDAEPVTALAPKGVSFEDYVEMLTANDIGNVNQMKCFVE